MQNKKNTEKSQLMEQYWNQKVEILYEVNNGVYEKICVPRQFALAYAEMLKKEKNINRKETRRVIELEKIQYSDKFMLNERFIFNPENIIEKIDKGMKLKALKHALSKLNPKQKHLIKQVYVENMSMEQVAKKENCDGKVIRSRMIRIRRRLKKLIQEYFVFQKQNYQTKNEAISINCG